MSEHSKLKSYISIYDHLIYSYEYYQNYDTGSGFFCVIKISFYMSQLLNVIFNPLKKVDVYNC